ASGLIGYSNQRLVLRHDVILVRAVQYSSERRVVKSCHSEHFSTETGLEVAFVRTFVVFLLKKDRISIEKHSVLQT
ncbi:hypothetical protein, partial [Komagataeibacter europaeus]|uniref:hypothetical protein n=1 Tax=Komagataeibacter europaeus TaxID=33995 RepID=UPI001EE22808